MRKVYYISHGAKQLRVELIDDERIEINGRTLTCNLIPKNDGTALLMIDGATYGLIDLSAFGSSQLERDSSQISLILDGREFNLTVDDEQSLRLKSLLTIQQPQSGSLVLHAPMPGLVTKIMVSVGQAVSEGAALLVLEAMKMENEVRSPRKGIVQAIHISPRTAVEKGAPLLTLEY